ncbi:MAG: SH3 domain-containing protein [Brevinematales bacterium]
MILSIILFLIPCSNALFSENSESRQVVIATSGINLRETPSQNGKSIGTIPFKDNVTILSKSGNRSIMIAYMRTNNISVSPLIFDQGPMQNS